MPTCSRRQALAALAAVAARSAARAADDPWAALPSLLARLQAPRFASRDFELTRFGAKPDGKTDCTAAFRGAIDAAAKAGGGRVVVPEGVFLTGAIHLKSNINLHVARGATIKFNPDPRQYPNVLTRFEGLECMNYSPLVYAFGQRNVAITGAGTLDGQATCDSWWPWGGKRRCSAEPNDQKKARAALMEMAEKGVPPEKRVFGDGGYLRPMFVQPYNCENVLIEGVTILNSPMYEIHPVLCRNVTVRNVTVSRHGPNNDGCNPESSDGVLIDGCTFDTGDDCIAIKSGRNADGRRIAKPSQNIVVQNCTMKDGHGGVTIGSECSGGVRNVYARNCKMDSPNLDRVLRFKNNAMRGGVIEHISMRDIDVGQVSGPAIEVDLMYEEGPNGPFKPVVADIEVVNFKVRKCRSAMSIRGYKDAPVRGIRIRDCAFEQATQKDVLENVEDVKFEGVTVNGKAL